MKIEQTYVQKAKLVAHVLQGLLIFIAGCIVLAVFTKGGYIGGGPKWFFALCFLTFPVLVYVTMTPMWTRAVKFANAYAFAALDILFCIFWLSAFISVAVYNSSGIRQGAKDLKIDDNSGNCSTFAYGSSSKCNLSKASVVFGAFIFLFFLITTGISIRFALVYKKTGNVPWETPMPDHTASALEAQNKDAWSADTHDIDHPDHESDVHTERGGNQEEDEYALLHSTETDDGRHPGRPVGWGNDGRYDEDTSYRGGRYDDRSELAADALSPGVYDEFGKGNGGFNTVSSYNSSSGGYNGSSGGGYSFSRADGTR